MTRFAWAGLASALLTALIASPSPLRADPGLLVEKPESDQSFMASVRQFRRTRSELKREYAAQIRFTPTREPLGMEGCADCTQVPELVRSINAIITKMAEEDPSVADSEVLRKVDRLVAVGGYLAEEQGGDSCVLDDAHLRMFMDDAEELRLVFSSELDPSLIEALELSDSTGSVRYFRGLGEDSDVFVRVERRGNAAPRVSYYRLKSRPPLPENSSLLDGPTIGFWSEHGSRERLSFRYGAAYLQRDDEAHRFALLDVRYKPLSNLEFSTVVDSRRTESRVTLQNSQNKEIASASVTPSGSGVRAQLTVPMELKLFNVSAKSRLQASTEDVVADYQLRTDTLDLGTVRVKSSIDGRKQELKHSRAINEVSSITLQLNRDASAPRRQDEDNTFWLRYDRRFR